MAGGASRQAMLAEAVVLTATCRGTLLGVDIVEFIEARIAEEESALLYADIQESPFATTLAERRLAECAQKRAIVEYWRRAAAAQGITDPADTHGTPVIARLSMLSILAAGYKGHPDYSEQWG